MEETEQNSIRKLKISNSKSKDNFKYSIKDLIKEVN